jgi:SAM-dependent methyltransferase
MHQSVLDFLRTQLPPEEISGKVVLEIGSREAAPGAGARTIIAPMGPGTYIGTDLIDGRGVDVVIPAEKLSSRFYGVDVVVCVEVLEHVEFWQAAVMEMKKVLRPGGVLLLTTRSPGFPYHAHPSDFWRFTIDDLEQAFRDFDVITLIKDPQQDHPGVLLKARRPSVFSPVDLSSVFVRSVG